ncbi:MAG: endonuclease VIII [Candidatus Thermoplasmatota archaeon]|nr:endonuclease VIII [Candidatus Thermoplasmatota archaeon]
MPEGPEIRRAADRISKKIVGKEIHSLTLIYPPIVEFQEILQQSQIESITTRGKAMLIRFDCDLSMYSHNQLYGRWTVNRRSTEMKWNRSLRVEFLTDNFAVRLWSATDIEIIPTSKEEDHPFISKLGPDILDDSCTPSLIFDRLKSKKFCNTNASSLMLDQSFLAGIGNYLRSEILHQSGVHPNAKPRLISDKKLQQWAETTKNLSKLSYDTGGFTVSEKVALAGKQRGEPKRAYRHSAFCRNGLLCHYCDAEIVRIRVANRRLDFCPKCQCLPK